MEDLDGKVALVTGASRGIGAAVARRLHEAGARVALLSRSGGDLSLAGAPGPSCDVSRRADVEAAVVPAVERFGRLDVAVADAMCSFASRRRASTIRDHAATAAAEPTI